MTIGYGRQRPPDDHYPYEKLTDKETAYIARLQDKMVRELRWETDELRAELFWANKQLDAVRKAGIDPNTLVQSQTYFQELTHE